VPDYAGSIDGGVKGRRLGIPTNLIGMDSDSRRALDGAAATLRGAGAVPVDVVLPDFDEAALKWRQLCGVEAALAHEATFPARRGEYGAEFASLLDLGRGLSALDLGKLLLLRARVKGEIDRLLASVDLLLVPVMGTAAWSIGAMAAAGRTGETVAARLRYTAPFDLSGHPTLTLPGGMTGDGVPAGFQIVGRAFDETGILAAGHAYQQATDWHLKRPPL
jgi:amidase